jgi:hypothetical protein
MRFTRLFTGFSLLFVAALLIPAVALAQYPPTTDDLTLDRTVVAAGGQLNVSGGGFCPGAVIQLSMVPKSGGPSIDLGTATADSNGDFSKAVTIPADTDPRRYILEASGPRDENGTCGATRVLSAEFTVASRSAAPLAGTAAMPFVIGAFAALGLGTSMVMIARRRRARPESES